MSEQERKQAARSYVEYIKQRSPEQLVADRQAARGAQRAPAWCYDPLLRGFVMGNALAAPIMLLVWAWTR